MTLRKRGILENGEFLIGREQKIAKNTRINANLEIPLLGGSTNFWQHSRFLLITLLPNLTDRERFSSVAHSAESRKRVEEN